MKLLIELDIHSNVQSISDIDNNNQMMNTIEDKLQQWIHGLCDWHRVDNRIRICRNDKVIDINKDDCIIIKG